MEAEDKNKADNFVKKREVRAGYKDKFVTLVSGTQLSSRLEELWGNAAMVERLTSGRRESSDSNIWESFVTEPVWEKMDDGEFIIVFGRRATRMIHVSATTWETEVETRIVSSIAIAFCI